MRDIVHPALYCFADGRSPLWERAVPPVEGAPPRAGAKLSTQPATAAPPAEAPAKWDARTVSHPPRLVRRGAPRFIWLDADFAWLPSEVDLSADGRATFRSYVNGLDAVREPEPLRSLVLRAFEALVPLFERSLSMADHPSWHDPDDSFSKPRRRAPVQLRDRRLQVIVKAADYVIKPGARHPVLILAAAVAFALCARAEAKSSPLLHFPSVT